MEDKKQEVEKVLKTKTCARGIAIEVLEEAKMEEDNEGIAIDILVKEIKAL